MPYKDHEKQKEAMRKYRKTESGKESKKRWYKNNKERWSDYYRKCDHGITLDEFLALAAKTDDHCPVCENNPATHVHHDHESRKILGILCNKCNAGLGLLGDNKQRLQNAMKYAIIMIAAALLASCAVTTETPTPRDNYIYARPTQPDTVIVY